MKRLFDIIASALGLIIVSPLLLIVALWVKIDSKGPVIFKQKRVGRYNQDFLLYKFRSMTNQNWGGEQLITIGNHDPRVTKVGYFIRKYKIDELPQLFNVLKGDMSIVGPRPLVRQQVELYPELYAKLLTVRPGITCEASIIYSDEDELLAKADDPEKYFAEVLMPEKIRLNTHYVENRSFWLDMKLIFHTFHSCPRKKYRKT